MKSKAASNVIIRFAGLDVEGSATFFAFDDVSIPFRQNLRLDMHQPRKYPGNPVLPRGKPGEPDEYRAQFYGTVIRDGGKFRMWYIAADQEAIDSVSTRPFYGWRAAYAESDDGIHWVKPKLGLVEYNGSRDNNLVLIEPPDVAGLHLVLLHEPDDPDPARRFKMIHQIRWADGPLLKCTTSVPLFSEDGLRWKLQTKCPPEDYGISAACASLPPEHFEQSGLYKWQGIYYLTGQQLSPWVHLPDGTPCGRTMTTFHSADFVNWSPTKTLAYIRDGYVPVEQGEGKETHSPASVWNRGNVLLGLHGQWEGSPDISARRMPLGLLISNDGLHFREPVPDFVFVPYGEDGEWDQRGLISGQAFEQVGEDTYIWYGAWDLSAGGNPEPHGAVGLATIRRDGFGSVSPMNEGEPAQLVTCPFEVTGPARVTVNADGLSPEAWLQVELVDEFERPIPGWGREGGGRIASPGVNVPVAWGGREQVGDIEGRLRIRVSFEGPRRGQIRLYALYIEA